MSVERRNSSTRLSIRRNSKPTPPPASVSVKCATVGDGDVGKSTMLLTCLCQHYPTDIAPGPMDGHSEYDHLTQTPYTVTLENTQIHMTLIDTYGQDEYEKLRERVCASADVYILCYDISRPSSFDRLRHHWLPEIRRYAAPDTPFIIAGLKSDSRSSNSGDSSSQEDTSCVSYTEGLKSAEEIGASHYVECSSRNSPGGVRRVLEKAAHAALLSAVNNSELKRTSCSIS